MALAAIQIAPLRVEMAVSLHVGTGFRRGLVQRTLVRDREGNVYVPASTLKGKARSACEGLLTSQGLPSCSAPYPAAMHRCRREGCLVCRVFGAPGLGPDLFWHDALVSGAARSTGAWGQVMSRTQVQLSRARGVAAEARLYTSEATASGLEFEATDGIEGRLELTPVPGARGLWYELILLLAGLKLVRALGGEVSRGLGRCVIHLPETITVDGNHIPVSGLLQGVDKLAGWGAVEGGANA